MLAKILRHLGIGQQGKRSKKKPKKSTKGLKSLIIPRAEHCISRANISQYALKVLYRLRESGFQAYLVGGGVRDLLLGAHPKDFDIATDALPEEIRDMFHNCRLIGRRFRLAHIHFGSHIVEVATFRANSSTDKLVDPHLRHSAAGMILRDNVYGSLEEDVMRRDFTVNALYYDIADFSIVDYVGGLKDLEARSLRMIGDARERYREDPVRMLRAIRFAAKLHFKIHPDSATPMVELAPLVKQVPSARLLDEYGKLFLSGFAYPSFQLLRQYKIFGVLFPLTEACLTASDNALVMRFIEKALLDTDNRVADHKPVVLPFLLAAFLWYPVYHHTKKLVAEGLPELVAFFEANDWVFREQQQTVAISRRLMQIVREVWLLQFRLSKRTGKRVVALFSHPRFRAAYDFLMLRAASGEEEVQAVAKWWEQYVHAESPEREAMQAALGKEKTSRYRRKRKKSV